MMAVSSKTRTMIKTTPSFEKSSDCSVPSIDFFCKMGGLAFIKILPRRRDVKIAAVTPHSYSSGEGDCHTTFDISSCFFLVTI